MTEDCLMNTAEFREFDGRLNQLEGRMGAVEDTLAKHGGLLADIKSAVTEERASRGPGLSEIIRTVSSLAMTAAIVAALLIYVATSVMSGPVTSLTERHTNLSEQVKDLQHTDVDIAVIKQRVSTLERRADGIESALSWRPVLSRDESRSR